MTSDEQRQELDLIAALNRLHLETEGGDPQLEASIQSMEIAFRMQKEAPDAFDITQEPEQVRARYGDGDFARGCLIARRLWSAACAWCRFTTATSSPGTTTTTSCCTATLRQISDGPIAALLEI